MMEEVPTTDRTKVFPPRRRATRKIQAHSRGMTPRLMALALSLALILTSLPLTAGMAAAATTQATWTQLSPSTSPSARVGSATAYDPDSGQIILFGGYDSANYLNDTWSWNGSSWTQLKPTTSPPARVGASMAFDPNSGHIILFGGANNNYLNDTWMWNGTTWTQLKLSTSPVAREFASMAYDPHSSHIILFGGFVQNSKYARNTWSWDGSSWTKLSPSSSPPGVFRASMALDPVTKVLILFGGADYNTDRPTNSTWMWNGTNWGRRLMTSAPPARFSAGMAVDPITNELVLFGGFNNTRRYLNDTWTWTGASWTQLKPISSPPIRYEAAMITDPATNQLILFGGAGPNYLNDTWEYSYASAKDDQTISFDLSSLPAKTFGDPSFDISSYASASSGLPVTFSSTTPSVCTVSDATVMLLAAGTCTINANQAGNDYYNAAPQVQQSLTVRKADQSITVDTSAPTSAAYGSTFTVAAKSNSGLPVTYSSAGSCSNSGATFTMSSGTGSCTVTFSQDGNANYNAASSLSESVISGKLDQTITFTSTAPTNALYGDAYTPSATGGDSGNPVTFNASGACSYDSGTGVVTLSGVGTCTITADQVGNDNYNAAAQASQSFSVGVTFDLLSKLTAQFETHPLINDLLQFDLRWQKAGSNRGMLGNYFVNQYIATVNAQRGRTLTDQQAATLIQLAQALWPSASQTGSSGTSLYSQSPFGIWR